MMYAHSPNAGGDWHDLVAHLRGAAARAEGFAEVFGGGAAARTLGLWHDLGKFHPAWQSYLEASTQYPTLRRTGPDHKLAGALMASRHRAFAPFAIAILGHHGGLPALADARSRLIDSGELAAAEEALRLASAAMPDLDVPSGDTIPPAVIAGGKRSTEHFIRMVFSALVDADFLDTEAHFDAGRAAARTSLPSMPARLLERLLADQRARFGSMTGPLAEARRSIFEECLGAAERPPGVFRLTVPTGGGKTRAAMAFALRHAELHGLRRVIVAVPFISITEQTAAVYREIFAELGEDTVLEHHSGFQESGAEEEAGAAVTWSRLAAENWDAPIVVTTTVQLLESLFSHRPSRARKLHRIARSVLVLDEVQSLPPSLLEPTLEMLRELVEHYGVSVVLSTATQPAFEAIPAFASVAASDIVHDPGRWYGALDRVEYEMRLDPPRSWDEIAGWLRGERQALAVVNRKADALALLDALDDPDALHLSTLLCGAHRRDTIENIRARLAEDRRCVVVSTQVVEAGVDLDFPAVYRAVGPLDAIVQAAGRCNREGRRGRGRVVVFDPADGGTPLGAYRTATGLARAALRDGARPDRLDVLESYYRLLFPLLDPDPKAIQERRDAFDYPEVARRFRLIDEDTESVVVTSYPDASSGSRARALLDDARLGRASPRRTMRALQPYLVAVRRREAVRLRARGLIEPVTPGLGEWRGAYDHVRGLVTDADPDVMVV